MVAAAIDDSPEKEDKGCLHDCTGGQIGGRQLTALILGSLTIFSIGGIVFGFAAVFPIFQADGNFDILVGGKPWLSGGDVRLGPDSSADGGLVLVSGPTETTGPDLGGWNATTYTWALKSQHPPGPVMTTTFRFFPSQDGTVVFEQGFPAGLPVLEPLGDTPSEGARTLFPSFARGSGAAA